MQLRSAVITTNPRSPEATLDEFPDLFPVFSLQHLHTMLLKVSNSLRKETSAFLDIGKRAVSECTLCTHSDE